LGVSFSLFSICSGWFSFSLDWSSFRRVSFCEGVDYVAGRGGIATNLEPFQFPSLFLLASEFVLLLLPLRWSQDCILSEGMGSITYLELFLLLALEFYLSLFLL